MKVRGRQNAFTRFVLTAATLYLLLYFIYQFVVKRYTYYDQAFIGTIVYAVDWLLQAVGYPTFAVLQDRDLQVVGIDGSNGVWIGSNCNAITLFSLFAVFVIAYPGPWRAKLWYIPLGIATIHLLNLLRVVALVLIAYYHPELLNFNHTYTFTFLMYAFIFALWMIWVNKFGPTRNAPAA